MWSATASIQCFFHSQVVQPVYIYIYTHTLGWCREGSKLVPRAEPVVICIHISLHRERESWTSEKMFRPTKTPFYIMTCMILYSHTQGKNKAHMQYVLWNWLVMARVSVSFCAKRSVDLNDTTISMLSTRPSVGSQWTCSNRAMGRIFEWCPTGASSTPWLSPRAQGSPWVLSGLIGDIFYAADGWCFFFSQGVDDICFTGWWFGTFFMFP